MTDTTEAQILKQVETQLRAMFAAEGIEVECLTAEVEADDYLAKAAATTDPVLASGYRKLARNVRRLQ